MKIFAIAEAALLATVAYAAPASVEDCTFGVVCTFYSAPDVSFRQCFPTDGSVQRINDPVSVSNIQCEGATCAFNGSDGSITIIVGLRTTDVGPPQVLVSGSCVAT